LNRKRKFDPSLLGRKADFTVLSSTKKKEALLVSEVKPPKHHNNNLLNDLTKLGNEMKDALDQMIDDNILSKDVIICGLLVEGK
jgi:hypothetical protein